MKRFLVIMTVVLLSFSCSKEKPQQYSYTEYMDGGDAFTVKHSITAANDSLAYVQALIQYTSDEVDFKKKTILEPLGVDYLMKPVGFSIKNSLGEELKPIANEVITLIKDSYIHDILGELNYSDEDEKKAFAGAEFGMRIKEVAILPAFKSYLVYEKQIDGVRETVGNEQYDIFLLFGDKDELYKVIFSSMFYSDASSLNTYIKARVENLRDVIEQTYGKPQFNYGYPSIIDLEAGRITWAYKWNIGTKAIRIGVEEKSSGSRYRMYGEIVNVVQENQNIAKQETAKDDKIKAASKMF